MSDAELMPAAMEPRRDDGDDPPRPAVGQRRWTRPQWSPVVTTGTTPSAQGGRVEGDAAMEPRRDDGDDQGEVARRPEVLCHAAMEPRRDDGDDGSQHTCRLTCNVTPSCERCWSARR